MQIFSAQIFRNASNQTHARHGWEDIVFPYHDMVHTLGYKVSQHNVTSQM